MDQTTEKRQSEFSPLFLRWLVTLTIMTLILAFLLNFSRITETKVTLLPWMTAGGLVIQQGLAMFSGGAPAVLSMTEKIGTLLGLLAAFVIGPTMLFFSWRRLVTEPGKSVLRPANIAFLLGGSITSFYIFTALTVSIIHPQVASSMRSAQALGENRDKAIQGLTHVSFEAYQYRILPKRMGGGDGSYVGYQVSDNLRKNSDAEFLPSEQTDSTITLSGASLLYKGGVVRGVFGPDGKLRGHFDFLGEYR